MYVSVHHQSLKVKFPKIPTIKPYIARTDSEDSDNVSNIVLYTILGMVGFISIFLGLLKCCLKWKEHNETVDTHEALSTVCSPSAPMHPDVPLSTVCSPSAPMHPDFLYQENMYLHPVFPMVNQNSEQPPRFDDSQSREQQHLPRYGDLPFLQSHEQQQPLSTENLPSVQRNVDRSPPVRELQPCQVENTQFQEVDQSFRCDDFKAGSFETLPQVLQRGDLLPELNASHHVVEDTRCQEEQRKGDYRCIRSTSLRSGVTSNRTLHFIPRVRLN